MRIGVELAFAHRPRPLKRRCVFGDFKKLASEVGQAHERMRLRQTREMQGDHVGGGDIAHGAEDVAADAEGQLVDWHLGRSQPTADLLAESAQLRPQLGLLVGAERLFQPVAQAGRDQVFDLLDAAQALRHALDFGRSLGIFAFVAPPNAIDLRQLARALGFGQVAQHARQGAHHGPRCRGAIEVFHVGDASLPQELHNLRAAGCCAQPGWPPSRPDSAPANARRKPSPASLLWWRYNSPPAARPPPARPPGSAADRRAASAVCMAPSAACALRAGPGADAAGTRRSNDWPDSGCCGCCARELGNSRPATAGSAMKARRYLGSAVVNVSKMA